MHSYTYVRIHTHTHTHTHTYGGTYGHIYKGTLTDIGMREHTQTHAYEGITRTPFTYTTFMMCFGAYCLLN